ncbi:hypothetical protein [Algirhabdus cladophorae]|uniref:hypothetical protein n=1 Tax=Algirhabdus cladophorae TaxID=3377108 RepID=UPI003B845419
MTFDFSSFLTNNPLAVFGLISGALSVFSFLPYIVDTLRKTTKPDRASWLIWSVLGAISFTSQVYEGATTSLWFVGAQVGGTMLICALSVWHGAGSYLSRKNLILFAVAATGLMSWYMTDTAIYALLIAIAISLLGGMVTVSKAYKDPDSETLTTWVVSLFAAVFAVASVAEPTLVMLAYPIYLVVLYTAIVLAVITARGRMPKPMVQQSQGRPNASFEHAA